MKEGDVVDRNLIRNLRAAGCPMPGDREDDPLPGLTIEVSRPEAKIYDVRGGAAYVSAVRITNHSYVPLEVQKFKCRFPWRARWIWPADPRIHIPEKKTYRLPNSEREFPCEMVLNHRTGRLGIINPGDTLEGILLAFSMSRRVPNDYLAGSMIPADLLILDQYGRQHVSQIAVEVDRTATMKPLRLTRRTGQGLYGTSEPHTNLAVREQSRRSVAPENSPDNPDKRASPNFHITRRSRINILLVVRVSLKIYNDKAIRLSHQRSRSGTYNGEPARLRQCRRMLMQMQKRLNEKGNSLNLRQKGVYFKPTD